MKSQNKMKVAIVIQNSQSQRKEANPFGPFIWNCRSFLWKSVHFLHSHKMF